MAQKVAEKGVRELFNLFPLSKAQKWLQRETE